MEVAFAWHRVERERMVEEFGSDSVEIGEGGLRALIAEAAAQEVSYATHGIGGWVASFQCEGSRREAAQTD